MTQDKPAEIEPMNLVFDRMTFPLITERYPPEKLRDLLFGMCMKAGLPLNEHSLYSQAAVLEMELARMVL